MQRADRVHNPALLAARQTARHIAAQSVYPKLVGQRIPKFFDAKCRLQLALRPQKWSAFAASNETWSGSFWSFTGSFEHVIHQPCKLLCIRPIIDHERRERFADIHGKVTTTAYNSLQVEPFGSQFLI